MRPAGGRDKGHSFEIQIAKMLSKWVTGCDSDPCLWRSAGSGSFTKITSVTNLKGDIQAIKEAAYPLMDRVSLECKCYKEIDALSQLDRKKTIMVDWWEQARGDAGETHQPLLIMKRNNGKIILVGREKLMEKYTCDLDFVKMILSGEKVILVRLEDFLQINSYTDFITHFDSIYAR